MKDLTNYIIKEDKCSTLLIIIEIQLRAVLLIKESLVFCSKVI